MTTPDHFKGKPISKDAIERAEDGNLGGENTEVEAPSLEGFIYVPSVDLYFTKERALLNQNGYDPHKKLHEQNLRMPTIPEFVEFLKYLRANPTDENTSIYDEITEGRNPWRAEHLDAKFYAKGDESWVASNHIVDSNSNVVAQENERLEGHLIQDKRPGISLEHWLNNPTKQGLPPASARQGGLGYWNVLKT